MLVWIGLFILITAVAVYFRVPLLLWSILVAAGLVAMHYVPVVGSGTLAFLWLLYAAVVIPLNVPMLRKNLISTPLFNGMGKAMPTDYFLKPGPS